jgi:VWFA-related protein
MRTGLVLALLVAIVAIDTPVSPPEAQQAQPQQPTFRADVTLVSTDVIPRDRNGKFVSDLTRDNFTVLEDGQPQTLSSFSLVHGGRTFNLFESTASAPAVDEGIVLPPSRRRTDDSAGRVILIFVDDLHFDPEASPNVRKVFQTLVQTLVHEGDLVAVVSSGPSSIEIGPTYDRKLVMEAMGKIRGSGLLASEIFKMLETSQGPGDIRARAQMAFYAAYGMLGQFENISNKRKAIVYLSMGYDFDPFVQGRNSSDRIQGGRYSDPLRFMLDDKEENPYFQMSHITADIELHKLMRELALSANRANATIYTVDPRGLAGVVDAGQYIDQSEWRTYLQKTQSTLRYIAEETGGFPVVNTNDFATEFKRIDAETSDYYVLGFYSTNPDPVKRIRSLEVKVNRPDVTVSARRQYSLKTPGTVPTPPPLKATPKKK